MSDDEVKAATCSPNQSPVAKKLCQNMRDGTVLHSNHFVNASEATAILVKECKLIDLVSNLWMF